MRFHLLVEVEFCTLAQAMAANPHLEALQLEHQLQTSGTKRPVSIVLPVQQVTGSQPVAELDLASFLSAPSSEFSYYDPDNYGASSALRDQGTFTIEDGGSAFEIAK